jgi:hypothetical protein
MFAIENVIDNCASVEAIASRMPGTAQIMRNYSGRRACGAVQLGVQP